MLFANLSSLFLLNNTSIVQATEDNQEKMCF